MENQEGVQNQEATLPKIVARGAVQSAPMILPQEGAAQGQKQADVVAGTEKDADGKASAEQQQASPLFSDEQLKTYFKEKFGIEYEGEKSVEEIKSKLNPPAQQSEDDIKAAQAQERKEILDLYIANGGTPEQFVALTSILNADPKEFALQQVKQEYVDAGFTKEEAAELAQERFYQIQLDAIEFDEDGEETREEFDLRKAKLQKRVEFGEKKLADKFNFAKTQAEQLYNNFKSEVSNQKLRKQKEVEFAANVDKHLSTLPRNQKFELGKVDNQDLAPVTVNYDDSDINEVGEILKNPATFKQFFYNEDGTPNLTNLTDVLLKSKSAGKIARQSLLEGRTRETAKWQETFPYRSAASVGVGGAPSKNVNTGTVKSVGKMQRVQ